MSVNPKCVFVAENRLHADVIIGWLEQQGIRAEVPEHTQAQFDVLTFNAHGVQVWVTNPEQAHEASRMLTEREWARVLKEEEEDLSDERVPAICEECRRVSFFLPQSRGSCQLCRHCGAYVDVGEETDEPAERGTPDDPRSEGVRHPPHVRPEADD
jgi:hypothetical protein